MSYLDDNDNDNDDDTDIKTDTKTRIDIEVEMVAKHNKLNCAIKSSEKAKHKNTYVDEKMKVEDTSAEVMTDRRVAVII